MTCSAARLNELVTGARGGERLDAYSPIRTAEGSVIEVSASLGEGHYPPCRRFQRLQQDREHPGDGGGGSRRDDRVSQAQWLGLAAERRIARLHGLAWRRLVRVADRPRHRCVELEPAVRRGDCPGGARRPFRAQAGT